MNTLEEKNIFLLDIDEKDIVHLALFDINETLDFSEFKRILENNLLPINKNFYIKIFTANEDRERYWIRFLLEK